MPCSPQCSRCWSSPALHCSSSCMADLSQALLPSPACTCTKAGVFLLPTEEWCCILPKEHVQVSPHTGLCHVQINFQSSSQPRSAVLPSLPIFSGPAPAEGSLASDQDSSLNPAPIHCLPTPGDCQLTALCVQCD